MKTIALAAVKGGVGKTTLAAALADAARAADPTARVGAIDLDSQGSLTQWWNIRGRPDAPFLYDIALADFVRAPQMSAGLPLDRLFLDCPPGFSTILDAAIEQADLVLIPTGPSAVDLAAVASTAAMAEAAGKPYRFVLNRAPFRSRLSGRAVTELRDGGKLLCGPVHHRVAIAEAMATGLTAIETDPASPAARELRAVWEAAWAILNAGGWRNRT